MEIFCKRLKELREQSGMSLSTLGAKLGVNHSTIVRWESGKMLPSIEHLYNIAVLFGVSSDYLVGLED